MFGTVFTWLCVKWFKLSGWKIPKVIPVSLQRYVLVVAPHTSNVDFPVGIAARKLMKLKVRFVAKKELFKFPVKHTLLNMGGFPVDRSKKMSFVEQMAGYFEEKDEFAICVTPEGTRSKVGKWKTGFYHIARTANVPIAMVGFDYKRKWVICAEPMTLTGNIEKDFAVMHKFFGKIYPKRPENSSYQH